MRWIILLILIANVGEASAQARYAFGPKKGELVETEEQKLFRHQEQVLLQLQRIEEQLKLAQESSKQQLDLLKQQNQLLTTIVQFQQQQQMQQQIQLQQQQYQPPQPIIPIQ